MERWKAKRLIVNADDLALHPAVNRAVFKAHREGIVTSTTILVGGSAFIEAAQGLKAHPDLGVGVHLCLVDQNPVADAGQIPSLVDESGRLYRSYMVFTKRYFLRRININHIRREWKAQLSKAADSGLRITHLDSHQHLHLLPRLLPVVADLAREFDISHIRIPVDDPAIGLKARSLLRRLQGTVLAGLAEPAGRYFRRSGLRTSDHFFGFACGGDFTEDRWMRVIPRLQEGVTEIMVHPGDDNLTLKMATNWKYHWQEETAALTAPDVKRLLAAHGIELVHYGKLS